MDSGVGHQIGLELGNINVQSTVESEGSSERRDNLSNKPVKISVGRSLDIEVSATNIVYSFVIKHDCDVGVLKKRMSCQYSVIRLNDCGRDLRRRINRETEL